MKLNLRICITVILALCILAGCSSRADNHTPSPEERESLNNALAGVEVTEKPDVDEEIDYDDYDLVILRYYSAGLTDEVAEELANQMGWKIKVLPYDTDDYYKLNTKLMAGDDDFDIYIDFSSDFSKYMVNGFYTDLKQFEGLSEKLSSNRLVDFAADYKGEYIGLPIYLEYNPELAFSNTSPALLDYCAKNVDSLERRFSDPDGEKLFEMLKYVCENDGDVKEDVRDYIDFTFVDTSYCIMSPNSRHKEAAALYMERLFDAFASLPESPVSGPYPDVGDADLSNTYLTWKFMSAEVRHPIVEAYNVALESDGKESTLRKIAKEAASKVAMHIGE